MRHCVFAGMFFAGGALISSGNDRSAKPCFTGSLFLRAGDRTYARGIAIRIRFYVVCHLFPFLFSCMMIDKRSIPQLDITCKVISTSHRLYKNYIRMKKKKTCSWNLSKSIQIVAIMEKCLIKFLLNLILLNYIFANIFSSVVERISSERSRIIPRNPQTPAP